MKLTIEQTRSELRAAESALRCSEKVKNKEIRRLCAANVEVWKSVLWALENPAPADSENQRLRAALTKIARRNPSTYTAASAFYLSRREAQAAIKTLRPRGREEL